MGVLILLSCAVEALCTRTHTSVYDGSAVLTAVLLALCMPPWMDFHVLAVAALASIGLAKCAYGGLGRNLFNPAMVGYAVVLISFPPHLVGWPSTDAFSGATLLTEFRYREGLTSDEFDHAYQLALGEARMIAASFLIGGIALLSLKLVHWRLPLAMVCGLGVAALFGYDQGSSGSLGGLSFHLISGGTVMAAFFVVTDPVTRPQAARDQWIFGILIGVLIYAMRGLSAYPDGIAFAVLLANSVTPLLDRYTLTAQKKEKTKANAPERIPTVQHD